MEGKRCGIVHMSIFPSSVITVWSFCQNVLPEIWGIAPYLLILENSDLIWTRITKWWTKLHGITYYDLYNVYTVRPVLSGHSKRRQKWLAATRKRRQKLVYKTNYRLMHVKSIAEFPKGSILQYFRPSLSYHLSFRSLFCLFLSGRLRQVLYTISFCYGVSFEIWSTFLWWCMSYYPWKA